MADFWIVSRVLEDGGSVPIAFNSSGLYYTSQGQKGAAKFFDEDTARKFQAWVGRHGGMPIYAGQTHNTKITRIPQTDRH